MGLDTLRDVRDYLAVAIAAGVHKPAGSAYKRYRIPRSSVSRHLKQLVSDGVIVPAGNTRARRYNIRPVDEQAWSLPVTKDLAEHELWDQWIAGRLEGCSENVRTICHYGFTEMVNNVIDHSEASIMTLTYQRSSVTVRLGVTDNGIGIFRKLQRDLGFERKRDAIFELCKGKLTTDPARHTGEGIFFTTRLFDVFFLSSEELSLGRFWGGTDMLLEDVADVGKGTAVAMTISLRSPREMKDVLDHYTATQDDYGFAKTSVLVNLARTGKEQLISRSQARRLLARFEQFRELTLDFTGVDLIGPAFADEIFRVFAGQNPGYRVTWVNATAAVERMIKKALAGQVEADQRKLPFA